MLEALYSVIVHKQAEIIRVQREIFELKDQIHRQEAIQSHLPRRPQGVSNFLAMLACGLLIGGLIGLVVVSRDASSAIRWDSEQGGVAVFAR